MTTTVDDRAVAALARSAVFRALTPQDRTELASYGHVRKVAAGTQLFHVGDPGDSMMAILVGTVRISLPTAEGKDVILADLSAGEVFGEIALLDGGGRSADAAAVTNVELLAINRPDALRFLSAHPDASLKVLAHICGMLRRSDERMWDIAFTDVSFRLAKVLMKACADPATASRRQRVSLSQGELARMIVASREAVNRQLAAWQREGTVDMKDGWIIILQPETLSRLAGRNAPADD